MSEKSKAIGILTMNTMAFTICFACWMTYGVLITWLVANRVFDWDSAEMGMIIGIPVLTGAVTRLPVGMLTDRYGGKPVFTILLLLSAVPMYLVSMCESTTGFILAGLGFGLTGASFAVGIAFTSVWFTKERQGTALGIFGAGNAGAAITSVAAPSILNSLSDNGANLDGWRTFPKIYAIALVVTAVLFFFLTTNRKPAGSGRSIRASLSTLKHVRVWRFGLYYFLVFGMFVALAQWLIPYYVNVYTMSVVTAGLMTTIFSLPSGVIRALGGTLSDKHGARRVMYWVLGVTLVAAALLMVPKMDIFTPGQGVMASVGGTVSAVTDDTIVIGDKTYSFNAKPASEGNADEESTSLLFPHSDVWQEPVVEVGQVVKKKDLLAKGITNIGFQANVWVFTALVFVIGITLGIGKAAVYKHIPDYFPDDVGVVGGMVGVLGGLGGFFGPMIFGGLLKWSGLWTTTWMFIAVLTAVCLVWMHRVVQKMMRERAPEMMRDMEVVAPALQKGGN